MKSAGCVGSGSGEHAFDMLAGMSYTIMAENMLSNVEPAKETADMLS